MLLPSPRSLEFLRAAGFAMLAISFLCFCISGINAVSWLTSFIACSALIEWEAVSQVAKFGESTYDERADEIARLSYSPTVSGARIAFLIIYFTTAVIAGKFRPGLGNTALGLALILTPMIVYFSWAAIAGWQAVRRQAAQHGWQKRRSGG